MNLGIATLLYFGVPIVVGIGLVYAYVAITRDEYGEKLAPIARKGLLYPFGEAPYDPSRYGNSTNNTNTNITKPP